MTAAWRALTHNLGWKLLSVLLAVLLWVFVEGEPELVTVQSVPVLYRNVESTLALVASPPATVRLELRGASDVVSRENLSNVAVLLDLAGVTEPGESTSSARIRPRSSCTWIGRRLRIVRPMWIELRNRKAAPHRNNETVIWNRRHPRHGGSLSP
jgi:hypothetical protein